jgi:hypothetical protein
VCTYSAVIDHYQGQLTPFWQTYQSTYDAWTNFLTAEEIAKLRKLLEDFAEAGAIAKKLDALMAQPDCEDPDKLKLVERVAELEKQLAALVKKPKTRKRSKRVTA